ncbi:MAG: hypothetical protein NXY57DRAFT_1056348 [Lentinula lateritia]|nr:MAG: hypothetical protein NXY57DRAFT_1056348 [Lentinula lateritia]
MMVFSPFLALAYVVFSCGLGSSLTLLVYRSLYILLARGSLYVLSYERCSSTHLSSPKSVKFFP